MTDEHSDHVPGFDGLELRQLRHLLAVADAHSFTRAAEDLHLVQQALSSSIRRLEQQLGVTLFVRTTRRVELTSAGEVLVEEARVVMAAAAHALERVRLASEGRTERSCRRRRRSWPQPDASRRPADGLRDRPS